MTKEEIIVSQAEEIAELRRQLELDRLVISELRGKAEGGGDE